MAGPETQKPSEEVLATSRFNKGFRGSLQRAGWPSKEIGMGYSVKSTMWQLDDRINQLDCQQKNNKDDKII
jgi:hypothetical protein